MSEIDLSENKQAKVDKVNAAVGKSFKSLLLFPSLMFSCMAIRLPTASPAMIAAKVVAKVWLDEPSKRADSLSQSHSRTVSSKAVLNRIKYDDL